MSQVVYSKKGIQTKVFDIRWNSIILAIIIPVIYLLIWQTTFGWPYVVFLGILTASLNNLLAVELDNDNL